MELEYDSTDHCWNAFADYLCDPEANVYDIDFTRFKIRDLDSGAVLFEIAKPSQGTCGLLARPCCGKVNGSQLTATRRAVPAENQPSTYGSLSKGVEYEMVRESDFKSFSSAC